MDNEKGRNGLSYGLILLAMGAGMVLGLAIAQNRFFNRYEQGSTLGSKVQETMALIQGQYVDEVSGDSLTDEMLNAMLNTLDPHSRYLSAEMMAKESEHLQGHFDGIGVLLRRVGDTSCVGVVFGDGPSADAGLLPGDRIVMVDTVPVAERKTPADEVVKLIRGRRYSTVDIGVVRHGVDGVGHYKIRRGQVNTHTVNYYAMLDSRNGYIRISGFAEHTHKEFCLALSELKKKGMKRLIIDLRGNGGGLLEASLKIANELLPQGDMIVYTKGRHQRKIDVRSTGNGMYTEGDLVVMIDETSASASEVLAGAIQDNDRGVIMGRRSFGKGLVQSQFELADGSAIWLTTSRYYTPSGRCIQKPYTDGYEEYFISNYQQALAESMSDSIEAHLADTTRYYTKNGRVVYGGGGIVPDRVIPHKRYEGILYFNQLSRAMVMYDYAFDYVTRNVKALKEKYPTAESFEKGFATTDAMIAEMVSLGVKRQIDRNEASTKAYKYLMKSTIKAYVGQCLFGDNLYYKLTIVDDDEIQAALKG